MSMEHFARRASHIILKKVSFRDVPRYRRENESQESKANSWKAAGSVVMTAKLPMMTKTLCSQLSQRIGAEK